MIGGLSLVERLDLDFTRARRKAFLRLVARSLWRRGECERDRLTGFHEIESVRRFGGRRVGRRVVEVSKIVGSVGRSGEFDARFMPAHGAMREKWQRVDQRFLTEQEILPVSLYRVGGRYFVHDGNHRVSVAKYHGVEMIDAEVIEFGAPESENRDEKRSVGASIREEGM